MVFLTYQYFLVAEIIKAQYLTYMGSLNDLVTTMNRKVHRKEFLCDMALYTSSTILIPTITVCKPSKKEVLEIPKRKPVEWDPVAFNRDRGNAGAIPQSYLKDINGPDGERKHIGKHLPYIPIIKKTRSIEGFLPIMWGDPSKGHAKHPNAPRDDEKNYEGHWYDWIRIRISSSGSAVELKSVYSNWPETVETDNGAYMPLSGKDITKDSGKNTIYLAALPSDAKKGDTVRIYAHCKTHGEWIDFIEVA